MSHSTCILSSCIIYYCAAGVLLFSPISPWAHRPATVPQPPAPPPGPSASYVQDPLDTLPSASAYIFDSRNARLLRTSYVYLMLDADTFGNAFVANASSAGYGQVRAHANQRQRRCAFSAATHTHACTTPANGVCCASAIAHTRVHMCSTIIISCPVRPCLHTHMYAPARLPMHAGCTPRQQGLQQPTTVVAAHCATLRATTRAAPRLLCA